MDNIFYTIQIAVEIMKELVKILDIIKMYLPDLSENSQNWEFIEIKSNENK